MLFADILNLRIDFVCVGRSLVCGMMNRKQNKQSNRSLQELKLSNNQITVFPLPNGNRTLKRLNLRGNEGLVSPPLSLVNQISVATLSRLLVWDLHTKTNTKRKTLHFVICLFGELICVILSMMNAFVCVQSSDIETLDLSNNSIDDEGATALSNMLKVLFCLLFNDLVGGLVSFCVYLCCCFDCVFALLEFGGSCLMTFSICGLIVCVVGQSLVCCVVNRKQNNKQSNHSLKELILSNNQISDEGAAALSRLLQVSSHTNTKEERQYLCDLFCCVVW